MTNLKDHVRVQVERLAVHGEGCEQHVVGFGDSATRRVRVHGTELELLEPQSPLFDTLLCHSEPQFP